jgi:hypothetical protein
MEGTLGAVDRVSLRGDVREAALQGHGSAKAGLRRAGLWI